MLQLYRFHCKISVFFSFHQVNEFSDHAPIEFSLHTKYRIPVQQEKVDIHYRWDSNLKDTFRAGFIGILTDLNQLTTEINTSDRQSVNNTINKFT
jgi:hypothetical protein